MPIIAAASRSKAVAEDPHVERSPVDSHLDVHEVDGLVAAEVRPEQEQHRVLDEERDPERADQRRDTGRAS
jgi:hypothetical protein